jgi:hypothetical protein
MDLSRISAFYVKCDRRKYLSSQIKMHFLDLNVYACTAYFLSSFTACASKAHADLLNGREVCVQLSRLSLDYKTIFLLFKIGTIGFI